MSSHPKASAVASVRGMDSPSSSRRICLLTCAERVDVATGCPISSTTARLASTCHTQALPPPSPSPPPCHRTPRLQCQHSRQRSRPPLLLSPRHGVAGAAPARVLSAGAQALREAGDRLLRLLLGRGRAGAGHVGARLRPRRHTDVRQIWCFFVFLSARVARAGRGRGTARPRRVREAARRLRKGARPRRARAPRRRARSA